jgi:hypothetical protein
VRSLRAGDFFAPKETVMEGTVYREEREVREVVTRFEHSEYALEEFSHSRHVTVACWYLCTMKPEEALDLMRSGLQHLIAHHGRQGYHETITRFWMELLLEYLHGLPEAMDRIEKINRAVEAHREKDVVFRYYSRELVTSNTARREWVEPDVRSWRGQLASHG